MTWLVVGLGNPGDKYAATRHNVGQMVIDELVRRHNVKLSSHKSRTHIAAFKLGVGVDAHPVIVAKSQSFMNETGGPIKALANFYSVEPQKIIALHDELDIPFAAIRTKIAGGDNGHNGLKSMTSAFGTAEYYRVRLGIGRPMGEQDPGDFVLKAFSKVEQKDLSEFIVRGADVVESLINEGLERTQTRYNS
ncbi:MAG: aminoacyl-tRNA hydrolase [Actinobacteria bacterium]|uniref:peptidyl-tRNA hydrolase n=1 Tax=freshwater metagenome TaxID=449393 RepID=A0A6J5ZE44_9ZZZZ|nr:aminoacyl-tRNA hydrolase [Actinomycetota bacterium]MSX45958.1 aminoacyl-tRNA hydrolase [Actinomycetota bacterium]MSX72162.1 aminoacyl-tRNA hydrolase [Actinomycetota bacterium]MSY69873.1 aminoacyl-tRNA hydrolase [Actinomycetota bacterium]MTA76394.1 aminoacyl-tRNA hydrolase [Actinomycetota bacterium]